MGRKESKQTKQNCLIKHLGQIGYIEFLKGYYVELDLSSLAIYDGYNSQTVHTLTHSIISRDVIVMVIVIVMRGSAHPTVILVATEVVWTVDLLKSQVCSIVWQTELVRTLSYNVTTTYHVFDTRTMPYEAQTIDYHVRT